MEPAAQHTIEAQGEDECWMRHAMALAAKAEGDTAEIPVSTAPMLKVRRQYSNREVRA